MFEPLQEDELEYPVKVSWKFVGFEITGPVVDGGLRAAILGMAGDATTEVVAAARANSYGLCQASLRD